MTDPDREGPLPQLARGGKHIFGWSVVDDDGTIPLPPEASSEYELASGEEVLILSGSRTSGGFSLARRSLVQELVIGSALRECQELVTGPVPSPRSVLWRGRLYARAPLGGGELVLPLPVLCDFGIGPGDRLLVVRGSGHALGLAHRGLIVDEANRHPELQVFRSPT